MLPYVLLMVFTTLLVYLASILPRKCSVSFEEDYGVKIYGRRILWLIVYSCMIVFAGLRAETVGIDLANYKIYFNDMYQGKVWHLEPAYMFLNYLVSLFSNNFHVFLLIVSVITIVPVLKTIQDYSAEPWLSIFLYFSLMLYAQAFCILRQFIAISIVFWGYRYIEKKCIWKFALCILLAFMFHKTAAIMIICLFSIKIYKQSYYIIITIIGAFLFVIHRPLTNYILHQFGLYDLYKDLPIDIGITQIIIYGFVSILCMIYFNKLLERKKSNIFLINIANLTFIFNITCFWFPIYARVIQYSNVFLLILLPEIIQCEDRKEIKRFYKVAMVSMFFIFYLYSLCANTAGLLPYQFLN